MSEKFSPDEAPTPHNLHQFTDLKAQLQSEAQTEPEQAAVEQSFREDNLEDLDLITDPQFSAMLTPAEHKEEFDRLYPAFDKVMERYSRPSLEKTESRSPLFTVEQVTERLDELMAKLPPSPEKPPAFRNAAAAYEWYKRLGPGELMGVNARELVAASRSALTSAPELRHKDDELSYKNHLDRLLAGACMLIEAGSLEEITANTDPTLREEIEETAQQVLRSLAQPTSKGKTPGLRELDEWYAMQAGMYLANLGDVAAERHNGVPSLSVTHLAQLGHELPQFLYHHPGAEQDVVGLRTEMAVYLLLDNWARAMKRNGMDLSVRKAFPREDAPHDGKRKQDRRSVDVVLTRRNADDSHDKFLIQDKTADAHGNLKTNEDMGYSSQVILVWLRAEDAEQILKVYGDVQQRKEVDHRRLQFVTEARSKVIQQSSLGELVRN